MIPVHVDFATPILRLPSIASIFHGYRYHLRLRSSWVGFLWLQRRKVVVAIPRIASDDRRNQQAAANLVDPPICQPPANQCTPPSSL